MHKEVSVLLMTLSLMIFLLMLLIVCATYTDTTKVISSCCFFFVEYDYRNLNSTFSVYAGGTFSPSFLEIVTYYDGVTENLEGFVLFLEIAEPELDERDVGNVSLSRSTYLLRINQTGTG